MKISHLFTKKTIIGIKIAITAFLIVLFFKHVNFTLLIKHLNLHIVGSILLVQPLMLFSNIILAYRLSALVRTPPAPFIPSLKATVLSIGLNNILPVQMSQMFKVSYLRDHAGVPAGATLAGIFLEKVIDLILLSLLALACIGSLFGGKMNVIYVLVLIPVALLFLILFFERPILTLNSRFPLKGIRGIMERFILQLSSQLRDKVFYKAVLFGAAAIAVSILGMLLLLQSLGSIPIGIREVVGVYVATSIFGSVLTALPGGFGTYEASAAFILKNSGYSIEEALALSLALHLSQIVLFFIWSLIVVMKERIGIVSLIQQLRNQGASYG